MLKVDNLVLFDNLDSYLSIVLLLSEPLSGELLLHLPADEYASSAVLGLRPAVKPDP